MAYKDKNPDEIEKSLSTYKANYEQAFGAQVKPADLVQRIQMEIQRKQEEFFTQTFSDWNSKNLIEAMGVLSKPETPKKKGKG